MQIKYKLCIVVGVIVAFVTIILFPRKPEGRYRMDKIASEGIAYYEFKDSKVTLFIPKGRSKNYGMEIKNIGTYSKQGKKWICITADGYKYELLADIFSIKLYDLDNKSVERLPRFYEN